MAVSLVMAEGDERACLAASCTALGTSLACCGLAASSRARTVTKAFAINLRYRWRGIVGRSPMQVARLSSPSARSTSRVKPCSENSAPGLLTVLWITSSLPRSTSTSVTASLSTLRVEIAIKCAWLLLRAASISASSSRLRLRQHRGCDLDDIVQRRRADGEPRRGIERSQTIGKQRLGGGLDVLHQALEDVVEQLDLLVRVICRAAEEKIGHPAQGFDPASDRSVRKRGLQFVEQTLGSGCGFRTHNSILERSDMQSGDGSPSPETEVIGSGAGDAVASLCLGCVERVVGAGE